ncbi:hypothetical protein PAERUG_E15_London_28_01_14_03991 [Pseudomonas aeruginosa]|nr:hypothetical protein PAERUG_E15_London_28_01_14_03991 [Pseudomonas aeruginosa]
MTIACIEVETIVTEAAYERVVTNSAMQPVSAFPTAQHVVTRPAMYDVVPQASTNVIPGRTTSNGVIPPHAIDKLTVVATDHHLGGSGSHARLIRLAGQDGVCDYMGVEFIGKHDAAIGKFDPIYLARASYGRLGIAERRIDNEDILGTLYADAEGQPVKHVGTKGKLQIGQCDIRAEPQGVRTVLGGIAHPIHLVATLEQVDIVSIAATQVVLACTTIHQRNAVTCV